MEPSTYLSATGRCDAEQEILVRKVSQSLSHCRALVLAQTNCSNYFTYSAKKSCHCVPQGATPTLDIGIRGFGCFAFPVKDFEGSEGVLQSVDGNVEDDYAFYVSL